jgi:hypothetical protein
MKENGTNQLLIGADAFNLLGEGVHTVGKKTHVLSTIVQMLDVITSFNFNCYSPMMD